MNIEIHKDLSAYNTFHLPSRAAAFCALTDAALLSEICALPQFDRVATVWLGGGSNVLFPLEYPGLVVHMANLGIRELSRAHGCVRVEAQAGENWHRFVQYTLAQGWSGLENLSLIPGTVGAAPVQNIGAYGIEVKDFIESVRCYDLDSGTFVDLPNAACRFGYRDSLFKQAGKGRYVIVSVTFLLNEVFTAKLDYGDLATVTAANCGGRTPTAQDVSDAVCQVRRNKLPDPQQLGNVGSFYKNPIVSADHAAGLSAHYPAMPCYPQPDGSVKLAAGWLIDQCGLKGRRIGAAAVHDKQALVLVNLGGATLADVRALSDAVQAAVAERFGVVLECEPSWL